MAVATVIFGNPPKAVEGRNDSQLFVSRPALVRVPAEAVPHRAGLFTQPNPKPPPVGGRLQKFWKIWRDLGASPWVVRTLKVGYTLPFSSHPALARSPVVVSGYKDRAKQETLLDQVEQLLQKGAIEPVECQNSLGFYSRLFIVPKKKGGGGRSSTSAP